MRVSLRVLFAGAAVAMLVSASPSAQSGASYTPPRTPWGEPDLQGVYNGNDLQGVPMQRAESVGTRQELNDEEYRQRVANRDRLLQSDHDEFDLELAEKFESFGAVGGPVSPPPHWLERAKNVSRQASFLIDPPNGRFPPLTPEAQQRREA